MVWSAVFRILGNALVLRIIESSPLLLPVI
jgi:hypothetical protein